MAIDNRTLDQITGDVVNVTGTEFNYRRGLTDIAEQVNANEIDINVDRNLNVTGDMTGTVAFNLGDDGNRDINLEIQLDTGEILGTDIGDAQLTTNLYVDNSVTAAKIADNAILTRHIAPAARQRFRILDTNGTTALLDVDVLIRQ